MKLGFALCAALLVSGCATYRGVSYPSTDYTTKFRLGDVNIRSLLSKPRGTGPYPAVVLLHGCAGPSPDRDAYWADDLTSWGYVTIRPDSLTSRGIPNACEGGPYTVSPKMRVQDAYDALEYLSSLPFVDIDRVAVMGWSHGGETILATMGTWALRDQTRRFKAAIAFYPDCDVRASGAEFYAPILILAGSESDWTPRCEWMVKHRTSIDVPLHIVVYQGAYLGFDLRRPPSVYLGHQL
ncbi:MAG: dienelactone hydrolase family protein, partial [Nitrospiraceae bacterium]